MTLIVASCNSDVAVLAADTRLTSNGKLYDDASVKITCVKFHDGQLLAAYTGLSVWGAFDTRRWLVEVLCDKAIPQTANAALLVLKECATKDFSTLPALREILPACKRLSIVFVGYINRQPVAAILSNFENLVDGKTYSSAQNEFWLSCWPVRADQTAWAECFGTSQVVATEDLRELKALVRERKSALAIKGKSHAIIVRGHEDPKGVGVIGGNILTATLPAGADAPTSWYSPEGEEEALRLADMFVVGHFATRDLTITTRGAPQPARTLKRGRGGKHQPNGGSRK